ncbi:MAG: hypothetical protein K2L19_01840 [Eubacterium sp.]|nr:hypothetical protein [Eubacterium sp.]
MTNIEKLIQLAKENPNLPIIPMVGTDVVASDEYSYWLASFGEVELGRYYVSDERVILDLDDLTEEILDEHCCDDEWENLSDEEQVKKAENIAKKKMKSAIIVYIDTPKE